MTTLQQHIDGLDMRTWAALTRRTAERAVAAAEQLGQEPPAQLAAVAAMSEAQLIAHRQKNTWKAKPKRPTARMKLIEAGHQRALAEQRADDAQQDKEDAVAEAAAARAQAREAAAAAEAAREHARAALGDLVGKELQRTTERRETQAELESLRIEFDRVRADATVARAEAQESATAAEAARERERAALDELARKGAQHAGEQRKVRAALESSQAALEKLRGELDQVRADADSEVAAARAEASAAQERAEQRLAERAEERREAQAALEWWHGELERVRADADSEVAAAREQVSAAEDRANRRMAERAADRVSSQQALEQLEAQLASVRADVAAQVHAAREQAALAIASAQQDMDDTIARVRAEAAQHLEEAVQARARAEADADGARAQAQIAQAAAQGLTIPIPPWEVRPETRRIENALTALHQINYVLEVGMAEEVKAQIPLDPELVCSLVRTVQGQAKALGQEFGDLPARFSADSQVQAAASYADAATGACRALLRRIDTAAQQLRHRDSGPEAEVIAAVMSMLADPQVQDLVPQP